MEEEFQVVVEEVGMFIKVHAGHYILAGTKGNIIMNASATLYLTSYRVGHDHWICELHHCEGLSGGLLSSSVL